MMLPIWATEHEAPPVIAEECSCWVSHGVSYGLGPAVKATVVSSVFGNFTIRVDFSAFLPPDFNESFLCGSEGVSINDPASSLIKIIVESCEEFINSFFLNFLLVLDVAICTKRINLTLLLVSSSMELSNQAIAIAFLAFHNWYFGSVIGGCALSPVSFVLGVVSLSDSRVPVAVELVLFSVNMVAAEKN
ncbi:hypothetical protein LIER_36148 [Lithospermum erythrorhizon]|uniref:Uncharacterized protein n=1 Tax=Lithospermum erythrorhizon TaxID=34254 RepID=A0AAV3P5T1_LITER